MAKDHLARFKDANISTTRSAHPILWQWQPRTGGMFKINSDAALFDDEGRVGAGAVTRNREGEVLAAISQKLYEQFDAEVG